tara:strand:+ start:979 stop:2040 length:1062 start_codon:yes stop_codon:yes gene_type:complete
MADFNVNHITGKQGQQGTVLAGVTTVSSIGSMRIPSGSTEHRGGRGRGLIGAGGYPNGVTGVDYIDIPTTGNGNDFGDLINGNYGRGSFSSATRGVIGGGAGSPYTNAIEYNTISSQGGSLDFGDLTIARRFLRATSNNTRGTWMGGGRPSTDKDVYSIKIDYNEIASRGNAIDFGDMIEGRSGQNATLSSPTRGITAGDQGYSPYTGVAAASKTIEFITFATKGNGTLFGELSSERQALQGLSSHTRGVFGGGNPGSPAPNNKTDTMEYITIATLGDVVDFGNLTSAVNSLMGTSNNIRGVFAGGYAAPAEINVIQYITIASTGNATDFGDLVNSKGYLPVALSDSHGGIGD